MNAPARVARLPGHRPLSAGDNRARRRVPQRRCLLVSDERRAITSAAYLTLADARAQRLLEGELRRQPDSQLPAVRFEDGAVALLGRIGLAPRKVRAAQSADPAAIRNRGSVLAAAFALSLAADNVHWGAEARVRDSRLMLVRSSANSDPSVDRDRLRRALQRLSQERRGESAWRPTVTPPEARRLLEGGALRVERVPSGGSGRAADIFRRGVTTWSMPYRGREGRSAWYVAYIEDDLDSAPLGIIEVGDDAPLSPRRDEALGFDAGVLTHVSAAELAVRFAALRGSLRPAPLDATQRLLGADGRDAMERLAALTRLEAVDPSHIAVATGLRGTLDDRVQHSGSPPRMDQDQGEVPEDVAIRKWATYAWRLVLGEAAVRAEGEAAALREGVRALRDITLPRLSLEVTICGALPPFGPMLGGKLVASLIAHPAVTAAAEGSIGFILRSAFDPKRLQPLLPAGPAVAMTTKGLYEGHSAQYTGVVYPGTPTWRPRLKHIGDTAGDTTSHISEMTMDLADALMRLWASTGPNGVPAISRAYGSGGGKRQRIIEHVTRQLGLPVELSHAGIKRPVYLLSLARNLQRVALLNETPVGLDDLRLDAAEYEALALDGWRRRWLPVATRRMTAVA